MTRTLKNVYRPVVLAVDDNVYEVHLGRPGKPRIYLRVGASLRRVPDDDSALLVKIAREMRIGVDARKKAEERIRRHRRSWWGRLFRWFGRLMARAAQAVNPTWGE